MIALIITLQSHMKATTQSEMVNNAVRKPGQAQMTMKIMRIAQRIIPIMVVVFRGCYSLMIYISWSVISSGLISVISPSDHIFSALSCAS